MSTNRSMSRGATGELGSRAGTQNFSVAGSGWTDDSSRSSTVSTFCVRVQNPCIVLFQFDSGKCFNDMYDNRYGTKLLPLTCL